jgi:Mrp family chromosome partitioning ATPase
VTKSRDKELGVPAVLEIPASAEDDAVVMGEESPLKHNGHLQLEPAGTPDGARPKRNKAPKRIEQRARELQEQCVKLCASVLFRTQSPPRSLGITSAIEGEGKSLVSLISAVGLAASGGKPLTLVECNWRHPGLHDHFDVPGVPGLAEWLRGECGIEAIRRTVRSNLTIITAGDERNGAMGLLQSLKEIGLRATLNGKDELLIVDLPPVITSSYGALAASLVDSLFIVVCARVTPREQVAQACMELRHLPVEGLVLNQVQSRIPDRIVALL